MDRISKIRKPVLRLVQIVVGVGIAYLLFSLSGFEYRSPSYIDVLNREFDLIPAPQGVKRIGDVRRVRKLVLYSVSATYESTLPLGQIRKHYAEQMTLAGWKSEGIRDPMNVGNGTMRFCKDDMRALLDTSTGSPGTYYFGVRWDGDPKLRWQCSEG